MKRIRLIISYDGTNYVGWQVQKNGVAIEQVINEQLAKLLKEDVTIVGASRTDAGVHALGNVAVFDTDTRIPAGKIALALNQRLPDDIKIVRSEEVSAGFHPRYADCAKTYRYSILNSRVKLPLQRLYTDYVYYELDVEKMRQAASYLLGEHDFKAFSASGGQQKTTVRTIRSIGIQTEYLEEDCGCALPPNGLSVPGFPETAADAAAEDPGETGTGPDSFPPKLVHITITGNGFLYHMVRIIAGTLEKTGMGIYPPEQVQKILASRDRRLSAPKAPARGLTLVKIDYF